jgi:Kazal-type serine protease inhibitor domain
MRYLSTRKAWIGAVAGAALLALGGSRVSTAETLDLAAMFGPACSTSAVPAFLATEAQTPAPNTPDDQQPKTCRVNGNCWKPAFCSREEGTCKGPGVCKAKPASCPDNVAAVCGCDNKTYSNECVAAAAGTSVSHKGECQK